LPIDGKEQDEGRLSFKHRGVSRHGRRDLFGYFPAQIAPIVVVALKDPDVPMAREALYGPDVAAR
jgi:hypothetical protein